MPTFGIAVDTLKGQQEIVLKPVPSQLGHIEGIGGATITGDGGIVLVLDPAGLYRMALNSGHATTSGASYEPASELARAVEKRTAPSDAGLKL